MMNGNFSVISVVFFDNSHHGCIKKHVKKQETLFAATAKPKLYHFCENGVCTVLFVGLPSEASSTGNRRTAAKEVFRK